MVKIGLEIHQQLDTGKLFCNCPSKISEGKPDFIIKRGLRLSKGEAGATDLAAIQEILKQKEFHYFGYQETTCLVEMDEEPPHEINNQALNVALNVAKILNCKILDRIQVMRKIVLDGSNTSGFQRTALVAVDGYLIVKGKRISILSLCIEEEACKIEKRAQTYDIYNLSRLGIPLVEIATGPDITSGEMAQNVAAELGMILRSVGSVKRGIGTIRQDVNVSVPKGARVEIKGAQDLKMIPMLVNNEAMRQKSLLELKLKPVSVKLVDVSKLLEKSECNVVKNSLRVNGKVLGIKLPKMAGILGKELSPGKRLGTDLSDFAKVRSGVGGLFHSDELPRYGISDSEVAAIARALKCVKTDGFVIIAEKSMQKATKALKAVIERINMLSSGIPKEVRKANPDGSTSYLRPMPGGARMYPETDIDFITPNLKLVKPTRMLTDLAVELEKKHGLSRDLARLTVRSPKVDFIVQLIQQFKKVKPGFIAETVLTAEKIIKRDFKKELKIADVTYGKVFKILNEGKIAKDVVVEILSKTGKKTVEEISRDYAGADLGKLESEVRNIVENNRGAAFNALMGIIMGRFRGKVSGAKVSKLLKKYVK